MKRTGKIGKQIVAVLKKIKLDGIAWYFYVYIWEKIRPGKEMREEREYYIEHKDDIDSIVENLADESSKITYKTMINFRSVRNMPIKNVIDFGEQYFPQDIFTLNNESFVDCGAYTGDTIEAFLVNQPGEYDAIYAFEPVHDNYIKLQKYINENKIKRCYLYEKGTSNKEDVLYYDGEGNSVTLKAEGKHRIEVSRLDEILANKRVTYIKMDIEGAETDTLIGAKKIILEQRPILAICIYHSKVDMIYIPQMLMKWLEKYEFYIRHYTKDWCDTVLYAVPFERSNLKKE